MIIYQENDLLFVEVDPLGSDIWKLEPVIDLLKKGAVGVIPTDTVYDALVFSLSIVTFLLIFKYFPNRYCGWFVVVSSLYKF